MAVTGWLEKLNLQHTAWTRVYAEYYGGRLIYYYDDEEGAKAGLFRGVVNLKDAVLRVGYTNVTNAAVIRTSFTLRAVAELKTPYVFMVETSKRQYKFCLDTEDQMLQWGRALSAIMNKDSMLVHIGAHHDDTAAAAAGSPRRGAGEAGSTAEQLTAANEQLAAAAEEAAAARRALAALTHPALPSSLVVTVKKAKGLELMAAGKSEMLTASVDISAPTDEAVALGRAGWDISMEAEALRGKRERVQPGMFGGLFNSRKSGVLDADGTGTVTTGTTIATKCIVPGSDGRVRAVWEPAKPELITGARTVAMRLRPPADRQGELAVLRSAILQTGAVDTGAFGSRNSRGSISGGMIGSRGALAALLDAEESEASDADGDAGRGGAGWRVGGPSLRDKRRSLASPATAFGTASAASAGGADDGDDDLGEPLQIGSGTALAAIEGSSSAVAAETAGRGGSTSSGRRGSWLREASKVMVPACYLVGHRMTITLKGSESDEHNAAATVELSELPLRPHEPLELDVFLRPGAADSAVAQARRARGARRGGPTQRDAAAVVPRATAAASAVRNGAWRASTGVLDRVKPPPNMVTVRVRLLWTTTGKEHLAALNKAADDLVSTQKYGAGAAQAAEIRKMQIAFNVATRTAAQRAVDDSDAGDYSVGLIKTAILSDILHMYEPQAEAWRVWEADRLQTRSALFDALSRMHVSAKAIERLQADLEAGAAASVAAAAASASRAAASGTSAAVEAVAIPAAAGKDSASSAPPADGKSGAVQPPPAPVVKPSPPQRAAPTPVISAAAAHAGRRLSRVPSAASISLDADTVQRSLEMSARFVRRMAGADGVKAAEALLGARICDLEDIIVTGAKVPQLGAATTAMLHALQQIAQLSRAGFPAELSVDAMVSAPASIKDSLAHAIAAGLDGAKASSPTQRGVSPIRSGTSPGAGSAVAGRQRSWSIPAQEASLLRDCVAAVQIRALQWIPAPNDGMAVAGGAVGEAQGAGGGGAAGAAPQISDSVLSDAHLLFLRRQRRRRRRMRALLRRTARTTGLDPHQPAPQPHKLDWLQWEREEASDDSEMDYDSAGSLTPDHFDHEHSFGQFEAFMAARAARPRQPTGSRNQGQATAPALGDKDPSAPEYFLSWQRLLCARQTVFKGAPVELGAIPDAALSWDRFAVRASRLLTRMPPASAMLPAALKLITGVSPVPSLPLTSVEVDINIIKLQDLLPNARLSDLLQAMRRQHRAIGVIDSHGHEFPHPMLRMAAPGSITIARPGAAPERMPLPMTTRQARRHVLLWDKARRRASRIDSSSRSESEAASLARQAAVRRGILPPPLSADQVQEVRRHAAWLADVAGAPPDDPRRLCWQFDSTHTFELPPLTLQQLSRASIELDIFDEAFATRNDLDELSLPPAVPVDNLDSTATSMPMPPALAGPAPHRQEVRSGASRSGRPMVKSKPSAPDMRAIAVRRLLRRWHAKHSTTVRAGASGLHIGSISLPVAWLLARTAVLRENGGRAGHPMWVGFRPAEWMLAAGQVLAAESLSASDASGGAFLRRSDGGAADVSGWVLLAAQARSSRAGGPSSATPAGQEAAEMGVAVHRNTFHAALVREVREYKVTGRMAPEVGMPPEAARRRQQRRQRRAQRLAGAGGPEATSATAAAAAAADSKSASEIDTRLATDKARTTNEQTPKKRTKAWKQRGIIGGAGRILGGLASAGAGAVGAAADAGLFAAGRLASAGAGAVGAAGTGVASLVTRGDKPERVAEERAARLAEMYDDSTDADSCDGEQEDGDEEHGDSWTSTDETESETDSDKEFEADTADPVACALSRARKPLRGAKQDAADAAPLTPAMAAAQKAQFAAHLLAAVHVPRGVSPRLHWCVITLHKVIDVPALDFGFLGLDPKSDLQVRVKLGAAEFATEPQRVAGKKLLSMNVQRQIRLPFWTPLPTFAHSAGIGTNNGLALAAQAGRVMFRNLTAAPDDPSRLKSSGIGAGVFGFASAGAAAASGAGRGAVEMEVPPKTAIWTGTDIDSSSGCTLGRISLGVYDCDTGAAADPVAHAHMSVQDVMALQREQYRERQAESAALAAVHAAADRILATRDDATGVAGATAEQAGKIDSKVAAAGLGSNPAAKGVRFAASAKLSAKVRPIPNAPATEARASGAAGQAKAGSKAQVQDAEIAAAGVELKEEEEEASTWSSVLPNLPRLFRGRGGKAFLNAVRKAGAEPSVISDVRAQRKRLGFGPAWVPLYGAVAYKDPLGALSLGSDAQDARRLPQNADERIGMAYRGALLVSVRVEGPDCDMVRALQEQEAASIAVKAAAVREAARIASNRGSMTAPDMQIPVEDDDGGARQTRALSLRSSARAAAGALVSGVGTGLNTTVTVAGRGLGAIVALPLAPVDFLLGAGGYGNRGRVGGAVASAIEHAVVAAGRSTIGVAEAASSLAMLDVGGAGSKLRKAARQLASLGGMRDSGLTNVAGKPSAAVWERSVRAIRQESERRLLTRYTLVAIAISGSELGGRGAKKAVCHVSMGSVRMQTDPADVEAGRVYWAQALSHADIIMPRQPSQLPDVIVSVGLAGGPCFAHARVPAAVLLAQQWRSTPQWLHLRPDPAVIRPRIQAGQWAGMAGSVCVWLGLGRSRVPLPHDVWSHAQRSMGRKPPRQLLAETRAELGRQREMRRQELMRQGRGVLRLGTVFGGGKAAVVVVSSDESSGDEDGGGSAGSQLLSDDDDGYSTDGSQTHSTTRSGKTTILSSVGDDGADVGSQPLAAVTSAGTLPQDGEDDEQEEEEDTATATSGGIGQESGAEAVEAEQQALAKLGSVAEAKQWEIYNPKLPMDPAHLMWAHQIEMALGRLTLYQVRVHVYQARHMPGLDRTGTSDMYYTLHLGEDRRSMIKDLKRQPVTALHPRFNSTGQFNIMLPPTPLCPELIVQLHDENTFAADQRIGMLRVPLHDAEEVDSAFLVEEAHRLTDLYDVSGLVEMELNPNRVLQRPVWRPVVMEAPSFFRMGDAEGLLAPRHLAQATEIASEPPASGNHQTGRHRPFRSGADPGLAGVLGKLEGQGTVLDLAAAQRKQSRTVASAGRAAAAAGAELLDAKPTAMAIRAPHLAQEHSAASALDAQEKADTAAGEGLSSAHSAGRKGPTFTANTLVSARDLSPAAAALVADQSAGGAATPFSPRGDVADGLPRFRRALARTIRRTTAAFDFESGLDPHAREARSRPGAIMVTNARLLVAKFKEARQTGRLPGFFEIAALALALHQAGVEITPEKTAAFLAGDAPTDNARAASGLRSGRRQARFHDEGSTLDLDSLDIEHLTSAASADIDADRLVGLSEPARSELLMSVQLIRRVMNESQNDGITTGGKVPIPLALPEPLQPPMRTIQVRLVILHARSVQAPFLPGSRSSAPLSALESPQLRIQATNQDPTSSSAASKPRTVTVSAAKDPQEQSTLRDALMGFLSGVAATLGISRAADSDDATPGPILTMAAAAGHQPRHHGHLRATSHHKVDLQKVLEDRRRASLSDRVVGAAVDGDDAASVAGPAGKSDAAGGDDIDAKAGAASAANGTRGVSGASDAPLAHRAPAVALVRPKKSKAQHQPPRWYTVAEVEEQARQLGLLPPMPESDQGLDHIAALYAGRSYLCSDVTIDVDVPLMDIKPVYADMVRTYKPRMEAARHGRARQHALELKRREEHEAVAAARRDAAPGTRSRWAHTGASGSARHGSAGGKSRRRTRDAKAAASNWASGGWEAAERARAVPDTLDHVDPSEIPSVLHEWSARLAPRLHWELQDSAHDLGAGGIGAAAGSVGTRGELIVGEASVPLPLDHLHFLTAEEYLQGLRGELEGQCAIDGGGWGSPGGGSSYRNHDLRSSGSAAAASATMKLWEAVQARSVTAPGESEAALDGGPARPSFKAAAGFTGSPNVAAGKLQASYRSFMLRRQARGAGESLVPVAGQMQRLQSAPRVSAAGPATEAGGASVNAARMSITAALAGPGRGSGGSGPLPAVVMSATQEEQRHLRWRKANENASRRGSSAVPHRPASKPHRKPVQGGTAGTDQDSGEVRRQATDHLIEATRFIAQAAAWGLEGATAEQARVLVEVAGRLTNATRHHWSMAGGALSVLRQGRLSVDSAVFELTATDAFDVRREDVPRDLPHWMRKRSVLRCALGVLLPQGSPVFKDYPLYRPARVRSTGSANPSGFRQSALVRAHISVSDPNPRWKDLEPLNRGQKMMRNAGQAPPPGMAGGPSPGTMRVLQLAGKRQKVTVRVYLTTARFAADTFFHSDEARRQRAGQEAARLQSVSDALDTLETATAEREAAEDFHRSPEAALVGTATALADAMKEGASAAREHVMKGGSRDKRLHKALASAEASRNQQERMRSLRRRGIRIKPEDLPDDAPLVDAQSMFRKAMTEPMRSEDSVFARVHVRSKSVQGKAHRPVLVPAGSTGRQFGFEIRRAEKAAGGEADASEVDMHECFELDCMMPATALLVVELFKQIQAPQASTDVAPVTGIEFLGGCIIDLEHRWLHPAWHAMARGRSLTKLSPMPLETRLLRSLSGKPSGSLQMWCDMLTQEMVAPNPPLVIAPPPAVAMQVRVIVWRVRGMEALGWADSKEGRNGGHVPFFVRGWMHDRSFDYRAVAALAEADGGCDLVELPREQRTSTAVAIPAGEAAELAQDVEDSNGNSAKNDFAASACATIGEMGFVPPLYFAKIADALERQKEERANRGKHPSAAMQLAETRRQQAKAKREQAEAAEAAAKRQAQIRASRSGKAVTTESTAAAAAAIAKETNDASKAQGGVAGAVGVELTALEMAAAVSGAAPSDAVVAKVVGAAGADTSVGASSGAGSGVDDVAVALGEDELAELAEGEAKEAAEESAKRFLPQSMWPGGGGPRPEDRVLPQATHLAFNWRMSFDVTHQRWGRIDVPGPLVLEVCEGVAPREFTREHAEIVESKSVGCAHACSVGLCGACACVGGSKVASIPVTAIDACGTNTAEQCGATRWRGRAGCVIDITRALKDCAKHPQESRLVAPGAGFKGVSNAQSAMAWVPLSLSKDPAETADARADATAAAAAAAAASTGGARDSATAALDEARGRLKPHSLSPAVLVTVEIVPLAASAAFAKAHKGLRPGLGRADPNAMPYLKDPGSILRQIEATRRKRRGKQCCAVM